MHPNRSCASPPAPNGINFIDEDNGGRAFLGLIKEISHPRGTYSNEHFYKFGSAQVEKLHASFAGSRPGQQCLSSARRPNQQNAFGHFTAQALEVIWVFEEFGHLFEIGHRLSGTTHVFESHSGLLALDHPRLTFSEREDAAHRAGPTFVSPQE